MKRSLMPWLLIVLLLAAGVGSTHAATATISLELSSTQQVANEGAGLSPAVVRFKRAAGDAVTGALSVNFSISGTGIRGTDYTLGFGSASAVGGGMPPSAGRR